MIKVDGVTKAYNNNPVKAVDDLSFNVNPGEIVGIIGPNGSGKTTTIKMMTGILKCDTGHICIGEYDVEKQPLQAKKSIGYISDSPDMFLRLKGIELINFTADIYGTSQEERKERIEKYSRLFGIQDALESQMISYSHGMRQKLMIVAALVHNPSFWILDEPLTGLDPESAYELKKLMREHADAGNAVLFSTHVLEVAEKLCDKVLIIFKGKKLFDGTLDELRSKYPGKELEEIFLSMTGYVQSDAKKVTLDGLE